MSLPVRTPSFALYLSCAAALFAPTDAHAASMRLEAPTGCPSAAAIQSQVEKLVGRALSQLAPVHFELEITAQADRGFVLELTTTAEGSAPRTRVLDGASCAEVSDAASVAIAMALMERESSGEVATTSSRDGSDEGSAAHATLAGTDADAAPSAPDAATARDDELEVALGLGLLGDAGALPSFALGGQLELMAAYSWLRVIAQGALFASQEATLADGTRGGDFQLGLGGLLTCGAPRIGEVELLACAGAELGSLAAQGTGIRNERSGAALWQALRGDVGVSFALSDRTRLFARAGVAFCLSRPEFVLDDSERVHQPEAVTARLAAGVQLAL